MSDLVRVDSVDDGTFWRVTFGRGPGNILDIETMNALAEVWRRAARERGLKGVCLEGARADFSFGASVQEHLPERVAAMLEAMRQLALALMDSRIVATAAVRGRCLGGGLEIASLCHRIFAGADATLGQPEIALGVFAPVASIVLPDRIGRARAEDLCLTGRILPAEEALAIGLVDEIKTDPARGALAWMRTHFAHRSASSLRHAVHAVRAHLAARLRVELPALERAYLEELMTTADAVEGLKAFLAKRPPSWKNA
jgi:cyclohexa-1,5-dienecarbonyl-CoA hydratase